MTGARFAYNITYDLQLNKKTKKKNSHIPSIFLYARKFPKFLYARKFPKIVVPGNGTTLSFTLFFLPSRQRPVLKYKHKCIGVINLTIH